MIKTYEVECPACNEMIDVKDCDPAELAADTGVIVECAECGAEVEFDYDAATDTLSVTPGQEFEDEIVVPEDEEDEEEDDGEQEEFE